MPYNSRRDHKTENQDSPHHLKTQSTKLHQTTTQGTSSTLKKGNKNPNYCKIWDARVWEKL